MGISASLRRQVIERAESHCEYCGLSAAAQEATFHIDHITPEVRGGSDLPENLALACVSCSLRKGSRQRALDPETHEFVTVFNPRKDDWKNHFRWAGERIIGLTTTGRATISALGMNRPLALSIRREETFRGRHPWPRR